MYVSLSIIHFISNTNTTEQQTTSLSIGIMEIFFLWNDQTRTMSSREQVCDLEEKFSCDMGDYTKYDKNFRTNYFK